MLMLHISLHVHCLFNMLNVSGIIYSNVIHIFHTFQEKVIPCLLQLQTSSDPAVREEARQGLALVGYAMPVKGRGINVLTLDGGGTR